MPSGYVFTINGQPINRSRLRRAFVKVLKVAGIQNFHWHDLRHTFASYLRQSGAVDLHTVSTLLGHRDLRMTKRYAHLNVDNLRKAVGFLDV
jgi:site-specific recombinase XerD